MATIKTWRCIAEDRNGKIHIFYKPIDESAPGDQVYAFQKMVQDKGLTILAMYREGDIVEYVGF